MSMSTLPQVRAQSTPSILPLSKVQVRPGDKWILIGTSGCGKTTALKFLDGAYKHLFPHMRHYVLDSKFDGDFDSWPGRVSGDSCPKRPATNERYQVWQPINLVPEEIEKWLWGIRKDAQARHQSAVVEIDELVHLVYKSGSYSQEYNTILKTGRSLNVGVMTLTQELSKIPANAYKQSNHRLGFYVDAAAEYDRRIRNSLLKAKLGDPADLYGFWYQHINGRGEPEYFPRIQKFLGV